MAEKGITFDFFYVTDMQANPSGGLQQTYAGWERIRGTVDINFDKMVQWKGLSFHATELWQSGADLGAKIGTLANPSDLVSQHTTRLDSFWVQQHFLHNKVRILAGQLAGLEFYGNQEYVWGQHRDKPSPERNAAPLQLKRFHISGKACKSWFFFANWKGLQVLKPQDGSV